MQRFFVWAILPFFLFVSLSGTDCEARSRAQRVSKKTVKRRVIYPSAVVFPTEATERIVRAIYDVAKVIPPSTVDSEHDWGNAQPQEQLHSISATLSALRARRVGLETAAAILTIQRIECGQNPKAARDDTKVCGLFQFKPLLAQFYGINGDDCLDPELAAPSGVEYLLKLQRSRVLPVIRQIKAGSHFENLFRYLFAFHYHGEGAGVEYALAGGNELVQQTASEHWPIARSIYNVLVRELRPFATAK